MNHYSRRGNKHYVAQDVNIDGDLLADVLTLGRPVDYVRMADVIAALNSGTEEMRHTLRFCLQQGNLAKRFEALFFSGKREPHTADFVRASFGTVLDTDQKFDYGRPYINWPQPKLVAPYFPVAEDIADQSMAIIGDGPAAILLARYRKAMGYKDEATTIISARGKKLGGIWHYPGVVAEGHNTFASAQFLDSHLSAIEPRPGYVVQQFLADLTAELGSNIHHGKATKATFDPETRLYTVSTTHDGQESTVTANSVCIATGNARPRSIDDQSAFKNVRISPRTPIKRWQEDIPESRWHEFENTTPVIVGLGNSAMAMWHMFSKMRVKGVNVKPIIITHHTKRAVENPNELIRNSDELEGPLARHPSALSRLALDIKRISDRYHDALDSGAILTDVSAWQTAKNDGKWTLTAHDQRTGNKTVINNITVVYVLIGYQNDPALMEALGCQVAPDGTVDYDPVTYMVHPADENPDNNGICILGKAAYTRFSQSIETIPGIMGAIPNLVAAELVRGLAAKERMLRAGDREGLRALLKLNH